MALPAAPHTFALETCRDLLQKLEWEIELLDAEEDMPALAFRAFNCAITAWHIADWVWKDFCREKRRAHGGWKKFQQDCIQNSRALDLCGLVTNASKHGGMQMSQKEITAEAWSDARPARKGARIGDPLVSNTLRVTVTDHPENQRDAVVIFREALNFWTEFIYREGIG